MAKELSEHLAGFIRRGVNSDDCWDWLGGISSSGYANYRIPDGGKQVGAHRLVYETLVGYIPSGLALDHLCRNKTCTNPKHLEPVTNAVNLRRGKTAKLTAEDIRRIKSYISVGYDNRALAIIFKVSRDTISNIRNNRTWSDIK